MDRGAGAERPPTTRIGSGGGSGRGLRTVAILVTLALAVAVVKPWDWLATPSRVQRGEEAAIPVPSPTVAPAPARSAWTVVGDRVACLSGGSWLAVVDQVDGPTVSRSWTRLDLVPATGPADPAIAHTHVYAAAVPRLGFCAPTGESDAAGAGGAGGVPFRVRAWRLPPATPGRGDSSSITDLQLRIVSGGTVADRGVLYGPPGVVPGTPAQGTEDPEGAWAVGGGLVPRPAAWSADDGLRGQASWPPGTYVFRVQLPGTGLTGPDGAWIAIELRGPWTGPEPEPEPSNAPGPRDPAAAP